MSVLYISRILSDTFVGSADFYRWLEAVLVKLLEQANNGTNCRLTIIQTATSASPQAST